MIFKTKNHYKKQIKNLEFQKLHLQIILQDTIEENEHLKEENEHLKTLKTIKHESKQLSAVSVYKNPKDDLYYKLKYLVIKEIEDNFEDYVKLSPIINSPCEMCYKQFATIQIERKNKC